MSSVTTPVAHLLESHDTTQELLVDYEEFENLKGVHGRWSYSRRVWERKIDIQEYNKPNMVTIYNALYVPKVDLQFALSKSTTSTKGNTVKLEIEGYHL